MDHTAFYTANTPCRLYRVVHQRRHDWMNSYSTLMKLTTGDVTTPFFLLRTKFLQLPNLLICISWYLFSPGRTRSSLIITIFLPPLRSQIAHSCMHRTLPVFGINFLLHSVNLILIILLHILLVLFHSSTPTLIIHHFHSRLKTHLFHKSSQFPS